MNTGKMNSLINERASVKNAILTVEEKLSICLFLTTGRWKHGDTGESIAPDILDGNWDYRLKDIPALCSALNCYFGYSADGGVSLLVQTGDMVIIDPAHIDRFASRYIWDSFSCAGSQRQIRVKTVFSGCRNIAVLLDIGSYAGKIDRDGMIKRRRHVKVQ